MHVVRQHNDFVFLKVFGCPETCPFMEKSSCALIGGVMSALSTIPIDVLVATKQQASQSGNSTDIT